MGDMSDLPNFKRSWLRRLGILRVTVVAAAVILAALAIGFSDAVVGQGLSLKFPKAEPAMIGAPYTLHAVIKNEEEQTVRLEVQGVLYAATSACVEMGKHLTMSNPILINVAPNATVTALLNFDAVNAPCEMAAGVKAFVNGEVDSKRFSTTQDAGISIQIL